MSQAIIRRGFETRLKTWSDALTPAMPIAWQNKAFAPPTGRYARAFLLPAPTQSNHLARTDRHYSGIFQVTLCMTLDTGSSAVETLIASLDAAFSHTFTQDGLRIWLTTPFYPAAPIPADDRHIVPVSAVYEAFA
jgi:hypothetical protein